MAVDDGPGLTLRQLRELWGLEPPPSPTPPVPPPKPKRKYKKRIRKKKRTEPYVYWECVLSQGCLRCHYKLLHCKNSCSYQNFLNQLPFELR